MMEATEDQAQTLQSRLFDQLAGRFGIENIQLCKVESTDKE